jgi:hypothetical protein
VSTQCAAVSTHVGAIKLPPQNWPAFASEKAARTSAAIDGQTPVGTGSPLTIRGSVPGWPCALEGSATEKTSTNSASNPKRGMYRATLLDTARLRFIARGLTG